jgi:uncharacterized membrane protein
VSTSLPDLLANRYDLVANIMHNMMIEFGWEGGQHSPLEAFAVAGVEQHYGCFIIIAS